MPSLAHVGRENAPRHILIITAKKAMLSMPSPYRHAPGQGSLPCHFVDCPDVVSCCTRSTLLYRYLKRTYPIMAYLNPDTLLAPCTVLWLEQGVQVPLLVRCLNSPKNVPACRLLLAPPKRRLPHNLHEASGLLPQPSRTLPEAPGLAQYLLPDKWFNHHDSASSPPHTPHMLVPLRHGGEGNQPVARIPEKRAEIVIGEEIMSNTGYIRHAALTWGSLNHSDSSKKRWLGDGSLGKFNTLKAPESLDRLNRQGVSIRATH